MNMLEPIARKKNYRRFASVATVYMAGVVVFIAWSYLEHRNDLYRHIDQTLTNATFTARELLGNPSPLNLAEQGELAEVGSPSRTKQLRRYADNSGLALLGAIACVESTTYSLFVEQEKAIEQTELFEKVGAMAFELAGSNEQGLAMVTTTHEDYGKLRFAILYDGTANGQGMAYIVGKDMARMNSQLKKLAVQRGSAGLFLIIMTIPLSVLYSRSQNLTSVELSKLNARLQQDVELQKERETELKDAIADLERFTAVSAGRETRIIELKREVNELLEKQNKEKRYNVGKAG